MKARIVASGFAALAAFLCFVWMMSAPALRAQTGGDDIVLYAGEATAHGLWEVAADPGAAGGFLIRTVDAGAPKKTTPEANPTSYFEMSFHAEAGRDYHLWLRGRAEGNYWSNDSAWVQFSNSLDAAGAVNYRIGTTTGVEINLEECRGCGVSGWGWEDNGWDSTATNVLGPHVRFATTGTQVVRIQTREDGFSIDQIVLSPTTYLTTRPGAQRNDTTILPESGGGGSSSNTDEIVIYTSDLSPTAGWQRVSDATAAGGAALWNPNQGVSKIGQAAASPAHYFEAQFTADANKEYHLWIRGKAEGNSWANDSFYVQFSGTVDRVDGVTTRYRIGTTDAIPIVIEEGQGLGLSGWGWADNEYLETGTDGLGENLRFETSGVQTIRIQQREDGVTIDQIVLSAVNYLSSSPGAPRNDATILDPSGSGGNEGSDNTDPTIDFFDVSDISPATPRAPATFHFMATASDVDGGCCAYAWTFGDGGASSDRNAVHTYTAAGTYTVTLTVTDSEGGFVQRTSSIVIASPKALPSGSVPLKVLQWNMYKGRATDKEGCCEGSDIDLQARWIAGMNPDVVALQEVMGGTNGQAQALAAKLADATGVSWHYVHARHTTAEVSSGVVAPGTTAPTTIGSEGVAIVSRIPLSTPAATILDSIDPPYAPRATIGSEIVRNGRTIAVVSAHFSCCSAGANDRQLESDDLITWMDANFGSQRIILGDLNATPTTTEVQKFIGSSGAYTDAWDTALNDPAGSTAVAYPSNPPSGSTRTHRTRIDYVFFSRSSAVLEVLGAQVPDTRDWTDTDPVRKLVSTTDDQAVRASDHNAVLVSFAVK